MMQIYCACPQKIDVDTLKEHDLEPLRAAVTRRLASQGAKAEKHRKRLRELSRWEGINDDTDDDTTTSPRRHHDEPTTRPRRAHDETTTTPRRHNTNDANTGPTPRPPTINGNPSLRFREKYQTIIYSLTKNHYIQSLCHYVMCSQKLKMSF